MHRLKQFRRPGFWVCLLGIALGGLLCAPGVAQESRKKIIVPINGTSQVSSSTNQVLKTVTVGDGTVVQVARMTDNPKVILVTGRRAGTTQITLTDINDKKEVIDVVVQATVEYLNHILKQVVPTANLRLVSASENTVIIAGTVARAEEIDIVTRTAQGVGGFQVVNAMRVGGVQQVQLCVVVARVKRTKSRAFGFNFLANNPQNLWGSTVGGIIPPLAAIGVPTGQLGPTNIGNFISSQPGGANIFFGVLPSRNNFLGFLQALEQEGVAKVLAEPRLVTMSGKPASFLSGGEQAVPVPAGLGQVGIQFEEFGTRLNFLPIVLGNGKIHLEVEPEISALSAANGAPIPTGGTAPIIPGRTTQRVHTTVQLEEGQTLAIGGLIQRVSNATINKVPVLGELPFVGTLFSSKSYEEEEEETVVLVTPHLVDGMSCNQLPKLLPGQETRTPDDFELYLEGILEAPRGPREVFPGRHYVPAFKTGPTASRFPCGGSSTCGLSAFSGQLPGASKGCQGCSTPSSTSGTASVKVIDSQSVIQPTVLREEFQAPKSSKSQPTPDALPLTSAPDTTLKPESNPPTVPPMDPAAPVTDGGKP